MTALLELDDVQVAYGAIAALKGVSLQVAEGEIVTLLGANGAGKTTTLRTVSGLLRPRGGQVRYAGARIDAVPAHEVVALGIGHVPEGRRVFPRMSVLENLQMGPTGSAGRSGPTWTGSSRCSPGWRSGGTRTAAPSPAASSRCWRSAGP